MELASAFSRVAATTLAPRETGAGWSTDATPGFLTAVLIWLLLGLMIVPEGFDYAALSTGAMPEQGSTLSRLLWLALLGGGALCVLWRARLAVALLRWFNPWLLLFAVIAAASLAWSIAPSVTARRMVRVATILLDALALVLLAWHARRFQSVLRPAITAVLAGSLVFGLLWPQLAIHQEASPELAGAWRGLANHKNTLGTLATFGVLLWTHAALGREVRWWTALPGIAAAASCLVLSRSSTSLMTAVFVVGFLLLMRASSSRMKPWLPWLAGAFVLCLLAYTLAILRIVPGAGVLLQPVVLLTGKDLSFTGRADLWAIVIEHIRLHPVLGTGYGAYWTGPQPGSAAYAFLERLSFYPGSAHNGYLDVVNDLGALGLLCLVGYIATWLRQALRLLAIDEWQAVLFLAILLQQGLSNLSESHWLATLSCSFVLSTLATAALARALLERWLQACFAGGADLPDTPGPDARDGGAHVR